ncbi:uncharacterized protein PV07_02112 [Cladophialophora immunda]|uniref:Uncharacterized protein n=1 Tax=Cladophialophora immunda TaxID=569365 RepID=A0A0D2CZL7_9EURO|nr:uncharacterized protein PV07_02112 [Cladophialophora immunda]KIW35415.1 hypothetical protein PV07_02112 [Cladophialophora immunda]
MRDSPEAASRQPLRPDPSRNLPTLALRGFHRTRSPRKALHRSARVHFVFTSPAPRWNCCICGGKAEIGLAREGRSWLVLSDARMEFDCVGRQLTPLSWGSCRPQSCAGPVDCHVNVVAPGDMFPDQRWRRIRWRTAWTLATQRIELSDRPLQYTWTRARCYSSGPSHSACARRFRFDSWVRRMHVYWLPWPSLVSRFCLTGRPYCRIEASRSPRGQ